jgi:hypothetical protein
VGLSIARGLLDRFGKADTLALLCTSLLMNEQDMLHCFASLLKSCSLAESGCSDFLGRCACQLNLFCVIAIDPSEYIPSRIVLYFCTHG